MSLYFLSFNVIFKNFQCVPQCSCDSFSGFMLQHPVYCLSVVGTQNAHNLISVSTDGRLCSWSLDMLSQPQETLELQHKQGKAIAVTCLAFPHSDVNNFIVGSEEGSVYTGNNTQFFFVRLSLALGKSVTPTWLTSVDINTFIYHVSAPMGRFQLELIYYFTYFSTRPTQQLCVSFL